jgi:restriction system protein
MPIPDYQTLMLPLLRCFADGKEHSIQDLVNTLAREFSLSPEELRELLPSGKQTVFYSRVGWAKTYLAKAKLIDKVRRSHYVMTSRGREVLNENPPEIKNEFLAQFPEFTEFRRREAQKEAQSEKEIYREEKTPEEVLEEAYAELRENLAQELLDIVRQSTPAFFERLVVELLVRMGYGGSHREAARAVGQVGDEGIDGIIDQDRLGLDTIYIQAKKWDQCVGRPEIQKFVGALAGKRAKKGVFITTSSFSQEAVRYVSTIEAKIVLIDGKRLAELMIDYGVGVTPVTTYQLKRVDSDYFNNG